MTNLEIIHQSCIKSNPEIMKLKFGCEVEYQKEKFIYITDGMAGLATIWNKKSSAINKNFNEIKILGREIRLSDVLLALREKEIDSEEDTLIFSILPSRIMIVNKNDTVLDECFWDLTHDNLEEQSPETINFLAELLK